MADTDTALAMPARMAGMELGNVLAIPAVRQVSLLIGVAASVALGVAAFLWGQGPDYRNLYSGLSPSDAADVTAALGAAQIEHRLGAGGTSVQVLAGFVDQARLELAGQGLPSTSNPGLELLKEDSGFGVSQFMETARYQHALETELSRTIKSMRSVQDARVHLAVPRQASFLRDRDKPSASVLLTLGRGRTLEKSQAESILQLVAGSIPNLSSSAVTIVDQYGTLLSDSDSDSGLGLGRQQYDYSRNLEQLYRKRVLDLMTPVVGSGNVRAEVMADLDFTETSETRESYDPANSVVRSEAIDEQIRRADTEEGGGIPGAISNQPPATGGIAQGAGLADGERELSRNTSSTRNFEIDKTVSVTRQPTGAIRRLSVAVLIDEALAAPLSVDGAEGESAESTPAVKVDAAAIELYTNLIKDAIGFDEARGDTVSVITAPFVPDVEAEPLEEPAIWESPGLQSLARNIVGVLLVLGIAFGLGRPLLKGLVTSAPASSRSGGVVAATGEILPAGSPDGRSAIVPATSGFSYEQKIAAARNITGHDPARVAQVLRKWVASDE